MINLGLTENYSFSVRCMPCFFEALSFKSETDREYKTSRSNNNSYWVEGEFLTTVWSCKTFDA